MLPNLKLNQIDQIVFEKPFLKFERLLETYVAFAPKGFESFCKAMPIWLKDKLFQKKMLISELKKHDNKFDNPEKIFFFRTPFKPCSKRFLSFSI